MKDSEVGNQTMREGVQVPKELDLDSVIINPRFTIQEMRPVAPDPRGRKGAQYRIICKDRYVEIRLRCTGERIRVYLNP